MKIEKGVLILEKKRLGKTWKKYIQRYKGWKMNSVGGKTGINLVCLARFLWAL